MSNNLIDDFFKGVKAYDKQAIVNGADKRDVSYALGIIRTMTEATEIVLKRHGMNTEQSAAMALEIVKEYPKVLGQHGKKKR